VSFGGVCARILFFERTAHVPPGRSAGKIDAWNISLGRAISRPALGQHLTTAFMATLRGTFPSAVIVRTVSFRSRRKFLWSGHQRRVHAWPTFSNRQLVATMAIRLRRSFRTLSAT